jgi:hypothetical protein
MLAPLIFLSARADHGLARTYPTVSREQDPPKWWKGTPPAIANA